MLGAFSRLGENVLGRFYRLGEAALLMLRVLGELPYFWTMRREIIFQMMRVGIGSFPLVTVTSLFTGMVLAVQTSYQIQEYVPQLFIACEFSFLMNGH